MVTGLVDEEPGSGMVDSKDKKRELHFEANLGSGFMRGGDDLGFGKGERGLKDKYDVEDLQVSGIGYVNCSRLKVKKVCVSCRRVPS